LKLTGVHAQLRDRDGQVAEECTFNGAMCDQLRTTAGPAIAEVDRIRRATVALLTGGLERPSAADAAEHANVGVLDRLVTRP
jgi:hypothetical protein